jgi:hypothetical protein
MEGESSLRQSKLLWKCQVIENGIRTEDISNANHIHAYFRRSTLTALRLQLDGQNDS